MGHRILKSRWPTKPFTIIYTPLILKFNLACTIILKFFKQQKKIQTSLHLHMVIVLKITYPHVQTVTHLAPKRNGSNSIEQKTIIGVTYCRKRANRVSVCSLFHTPFWWLYVVCSIVKKNAHRFSSKWQLFHISTNVLCSRCTTSLDYELALFF